MQERTRKIKARENVPRKGQRNQERRKNDKRRNIEGMFIKAAEAANKNDTTTVYNITKEKNNHANLRQKWYNSKNAERNNKKMYLIL